MQVKVRIIDKSDQPGTTSRAIVIHARSLEFYRQMGIDKPVIEKGIVFQAANLWVRGKKRGRVPFGVMGKAISPYPYALIFPQDQQEEMLTAQLSRRGVTVERNTELISFEQTTNGVTALLQTQEGQQLCDALYVAGCDGAHSTVRKLLGMDFPGGTYSELFYVADLEATGQVVNGEVNGALDDVDFLALFPMKGENRIRVVGTVRPGQRDHDSFTWKDVSQGIIKRLKINIIQVRWFSTYKVHHRVAAAFRKERAFLLGDAGHLHSPVGGQGMNTGIGDAVNLAWKISAVIRNEAPESILDTYEPERIAFARKLVSTTDTAFTFITKRSFLATQVRTRLAPLLLPVLFRFQGFRRLVFRMLSQTQINYRNSRLSIGASSRLKGGDRLPWVMLTMGSEAASDNYVPLTTMQWQVHCYGNLSSPFGDLFNVIQLDYHTFPWTPSMKSAGLEKDSVYLIRPDGYIGIIARQHELAAIQQYLKDWNIGQKTG
jgi:2-polyprenyl-6-methoxyphenol hydroxylase-like FAD-dependent oxidoreductase